MAVLTTSSDKVSQRLRGSNEVRRLTDVMLNEDVLASFAEFGAFVRSRSHTFAHLPVSVPKGNQRGTDTILYLNNLFHIPDSLGQCKQIELYRKERVMNTKLTDTVKSASPVPSSPPFPRAASLRSARNSGKLRKHTPRSEFRPSLSSLAFRSARRVIRESQLAWCNASAEYEESARNVYLCSDRLMSDDREDMVSLYRRMIGLRSVANVVASRAGFCSGESSLSRTYSDYKRSGQMEYELPTW